MGTNMIGQVISVQGEFGLYTVKGITLGGLLICKKHQFDVLLRVDPKLATVYNPPKPKETTEDGPWPLFQIK